MKIQSRSKLLAATTSRTWICDDYSYAISIREADETELPGSSYCGKWLNTSFYDLTEGPRIAIADDIRAVCCFAEEWIAVAYADERGSACSISVKITNGPMATHSLPRTSPLQADIDACVRRPIRRPPLCDERNRRLFQGEDHGFRSGRCQGFRK